jgi:ribosomal RNA-processing protein 7
LAEHEASTGKMPSKIVQTINDYTVLPLTIQPTTSYPQAVTHHLYLRPHAPKIPTVNDSRSLFLVNVPFDSTAAHFRQVFNSLVGAGRFEDISFENDKKSAQQEVETLKGVTIVSKDKKRKRGSEVATKEEDRDLPRIWERDLKTSGSTAVVRLVDEKSVEAVLKAARKAAKSGKGAVWGEGVEDDGLGSLSKFSSNMSLIGGDLMHCIGYLTHQALRYPDRSVLQASVDAFMQHFNSAEEERARAAKRARNVPDEDGFVTVTRGGRTGPARAEEAEERRRKEIEKEEKKKNEMGDFYRFQMRDRRKAEQGELVKRFEEDRRRVEQMKEKRGRFRPE